MGFRFSVSHGTRIRTHEDYETEPEEETQNPAEATTLKPIAPIRECWKFSNQIHFLLLEGEE
jgi:hypothetical protein